MADIPVLKDLISRDLVRFSPEMTVGDAVAQMIDYGISGAPVVDSAGSLVGVFTAKDCFRAALDASYYQGWSGIVADFMTREVETLDAETDIVSGAESFLNARFRRFPVLEDGRLIGIVTRFDVLSALARHLK